MPASHPIPGDRSDPDGRSGHVHRRGPLPDDDLARWRGPDGRPRIVNSGAWTYEPLLLHRATPPHPYWPGGAIRLRDGGRTTIPVQALAADPDDFARDVRDRLRAGGRRGR